MEEAELRKYLVQRVPSQWIVCLIMMMLLLQANEKKEHMGRQRRTGKYFQGSRVLACFFTVAKAWRKQLPLWVTHGTSLNVLRKQATPWDGDADVAFLKSDHAELDEMWNTTNMEERTFSHTSGGISFATCGKNWPKNLLNTEFHV